jgi:hypothetical protein
LEHVLALEGHLQAVVQLKLPHCTSSYVMYHTEQSIQGTHGQLMRTTQEWSTTWTPQNENNVERRGSVMNWCSAVVLFGEQLPEDGLVRPKHVVI